MFYIFGLGNPGDEYDNTRHNTGRMAAALFSKENDLNGFVFDKMLNSHMSDGKVGKEKVTVVLPDTFMNKSGVAVGKIKDLRFKIKDKKRLCENLIVVHDDLDIPFGKMKVSFNKSAGGHRGVMSIIKAVKTEGFVRVRVGISPVTASGKIKKPMGEEAVGKFILAKFKPGEEVALRKVLKNAAKAIEVIVTEGREKAMGEFNSL